MNITLTTIEIVAWWGAIVSTSVFSWDIYKWVSSGPKVRINVRPNMKTYGMPGKEGLTYVTVEAVNIGDRPTTLTVIGLMYYKNLFEKLRHKHKEAFIAPHPVLTQPLPHVLEPGRMWTGAIIQNEKLEQMAREGILMCQVYDSWHTKAFEKRINTKENPPSDALKSGVQ